MLHYYYEYRNEGDEDIQVVEDLGETHPIPQTAESMQRLQYMRDDAREHAVGVADGRRRGVVGVLDEAMDEPVGHGFSPVRGLA